MANDGFITNGGNGCVAKIEAEVFKQFESEELGQTKGILSGRDVASGLVLVYRSDSWNDACSKIFYGFNVGQATTIVGKLVEVNGKWEHFLTPEDIELLPDKLADKGLVVWNEVKRKQNKKYEIKRFRCKINGERYSIWRIR